LDPVENTVPALVQVVTPPPERLDTEMVLDSTKFPTTRRSLVVPALRVQEPCPEVTMR
jgi:hypothetical protein